MKLGYVDTSALVAVALGEARGSLIRGRLRTFSRLVASNLLEAEFRSALAREDIEDADQLLSWVTWVFPDRALTPEFDTILSLGQARGADLWHLACALYLSPDPRNLSVITLDPPQRDLARKVGFTV